MKISTYILALLLLSFNILAQTNGGYVQKNWQHLHGEQVAENLHSKYNKMNTACNNSSSPAYNCSGIELRGTDHSSSYFAWNPSPASVTSGGVSFSYLRADSKYSKLAYGYENGFFIYPNNDKPDGKIALDVLCSFPIDAGTENRADAGCGMYTGKSESVQCQLQGITDANGWYNHYVQYGRSHASQCGFGLTDKYSNVADAFYQTIKSMATISSESINEQNELRIATWSQNIPTELPIQAFFYLNDSGLSDAQADQTDFYNQTNGMFVPIIKLTLPASQSTDAIFTYDPNVQVKTDSLSISDIGVVPSAIETSGEKSVAHLSVKVLSSNGEAISGAMITWLTTSTSAKLGQEITYTNEYGIATNTFTDNEPDRASVYAYGPDGKDSETRVIPVEESTAQDLYIDALKVSKTTISASGKDSATITAFVKSKTSGSVAGTNVHWTTTLGNLSSATSTTDNDGTASTTLSSTVPGEAIVTATLDNGSQQSTWIDVVN